MAHLTSQEKIDKYLADYENRRKNGETKKDEAQYESSQNKISAYLAAHEKAIAASPSRQQMIALDRKAAEESARKKAQQQANVQEIMQGQAIESIESQALAAIKQRLQQGMGEFRQTDLQQGPFSGYQDPVKLALQAQDLKGVGPQKTWRAEALKLGQQAVEQKRQEYAQQGSVKDYAEQFGQKPDESVRTENVYKYAQEVPYMTDFEAVSGKEGANTKRKRTEEEAKKYEEEKFWAEVSGSAAPVSLRNQEQDLIDEYVSDHQLKVYNYLVNSGQQEYADEYWRGVKSYAQAARNADDIKYTRDALAKLPEGFVRDTVGSALSVGANMANAVTGTYYIAEQEIKEALTGKRQELDPQDMAFQAGRARDALRQDVSEKLPGWGKFLYETGMSIGDTAAMGALFGPTGGALLMGSGAAVDTVRDVKERGGSDQQALGMGLIAGGAELLTEKLGFDQLGKLVGGSRNNVFRQVLGVVVSEAGEEGATEIANILTDALVMGDKSEYNALVSQYMAQGMSEESARKQAFKDLAVRVGLSTLGGGLSGGLMGGGAATVGSIARAVEQTAQRKAWREAVDHDAATNIFTEGVRGGSTYETIRQLAGQADDRQNGDDTSSVRVADTFPSEGKAEGAKAVGPAIARMAQEYGEDASVFVSHYEGGDPAQYRRGFDAMWKAGQSGLPLEMLGGVSDQLTKGMSEATKQSIYTAGRNKAANTITPGVKQLTTRRLNTNQKVQVQILNELGKEYGLEIDVVDSVKNANGAYSGGRRIVVAMDAAEGAYVQAAAHEAVHYVKSVSPDGYEVLKDVVLKHLTGTDAMFDLETAIGERMKQYTEAGMKNVDREYALEEIVAEAVPTFFGDKEAVRAFVKENRTLAEKIRDFFVEFAEKVRRIAERYMQSQNREEIAELINNTEALKEIALTFDAALRDAQEKPAGAQSDGEIRTSRDENRRNRALKPGEMKNEFYGAMKTDEWARYFEALKQPGYNADRFDDGQQAYMIVNGKLLLMEMQASGEFSVVDVYRSANGWYNENIEYLLENWRIGRYGRKEVEAWLTAFEADDGSGVFERYDQHGGGFVRLDGKENSAGRGAAGVSGGRDAHGAGVREDAVGQDQGEQTRFSLKNTAPVDETLREDQNLRLPEDVQVDSESLRKQAVSAMQAGLKVKLDQQINSISGKILKETGSRFKRADLTHELKALVDEYAKHGFSEDSVRAVSELAQEIIERSTKADTSLQEQYAGLRDRLKSAGIRLTDAQKQEAVSQYGSYGEFRRQMADTANIADSGEMTLDAMWDELSSQYPDVFPADTREGDMPAKLMEFKQLMQPRYENIYGMDAEAAAADLALRIQGDVMGMVGAKNAAQQLYGSAYRMRERFKKEYDAQIRARQKARVSEFQRIAGELRAARDRGDSEAQKKVMNEYRAQLKKEGADGALKEAVATVRAANKVRNEQMQETREKTRLRGRIAKQANDLMNMLIRPEKGKRVPTVLQGLVLDVLGALDVNGQRAAESGRETKRAAQFREKLTGIREFYQEVWNSQSKGESPAGLDGLMMTISERNMAEMAEALEVLGKGDRFTLYDMDSQQLKSLESLLKNVKHTVESVGKLWRIQRYESIIQLGDASIAEMDGRGVQKITKKNAAAVRDFFALDNMEPVSYGERLGEAGGAVIQSLMDGEKIKFGKIREASEATAEMLQAVGVTGYDIGKWRKHVQTVELDSGKVRMTDAMLMSLYLTAKRPQGRQHLLANGMRIPTTDQTGGQVKTILLSEKDLAHMAGLLKPEQRALADRMGEYLSTAVAKWGNDVTQRMYLYDAFTEKNYWPLVSDPNVLKTQEPEGDRAFLAIVNAGFTKPINQKATSAVIITDAFDVFGGHIGEMASYAGYAEVMTDAMAWLNYKVRNSETGLIEGSVKESMEGLLGNAGIQYLTNLVQDINGARRGGDNVQLNKLLGNYKKAAVMGKIRVAIQQPTSIVRAAAEINPGYLLMAMRPTKGIPKGKSAWEWLRSNGTVEEMQKWSNLAWWKANGNYDIGIGKGTDAILWGDTAIRDTMTEKIATQGGLVDPGKMDDLTWAHMWLAVKSEIRRKRRDLEVGSDEYFRAVAERFEYVMDRTQVVDTVMHRSALMRGKDGLTKSLTSFMAEPTKSYNMLMRAVMEVGRNPKTAGSYKKLGRTAAVYAASAAATAAMTALYDAFRYRDDEDDIWTYLSGRYWGDVWEQMLKAFVSNVNPLSNIPIVKDMYDMAVDGGDVPTVMAFEGVSDFISACQTVDNYIRGNNSRKSTVYGVIKPVLTAASSLGGYSLTGILTNIETIGRVFDPKWMQTKSEYATLGKAYEKLYEATRDGNKQKALDIRTQLSKGLYGANPKTPKEIDTGIARQLALDDERIMQYWQMREKGNQYREMVALRKEIQKDGFTEEHVVQAGNSIESQLNNQYRQLLEEGKNGEAEELKEYAAKYGMELEEAEEKDMDEELDPKMFQYKHLFSSIRNGDLDDVEGVASVMELESDAENPEEAIRGQVSSEFREEYIEAVRGGNTRKVSDLDRKLDYFGIDADDRAKWLKTDRYEDLGEALKAGKTNKADEYIEELRESGVSDDDIASSVSSRFKQTYIDHVVNGEDDEAEELAEMLRGLGLVTTKGKNKYRQDVLDGWVKDWYKAQKEEED